MSDEPIDVRKYVAHVPVSRSDDDWFRRWYAQPAYHVPDDDQHLLDSHRDSCDDCEHVVVEPHDCPRCECAEDWWDHCDVWTALRDAVKVPTVDADGNHLTVAEAMRQRERQQMTAMLNDAVLTHAQALTERLREDDAIGQGDAVDWR